MKWWNEWTRRHEEGWVERKRRFQRMFDEKISGSAGEPIPALVGATVPATRVPPKRGDE